MSAELLRVKDLRTYFVSGGKTAKAVDGVSFSIAPQETLGLVGESGCGKSVCSLSILRVLPPAARIAGGEIVFQGRDLLGLSEPEMRALRGNRIAMVFQEPMTAFNPVYTVGYQVAEAIRAHSRVSSGRAMEMCAGLFAKVGIPAPQERVHAYPHQLSGGLRQRAMIAMALAMKPALLIADEPTTALDVTIQQQILQLLKELRREYSMSLLLISHDMGVVAEMADRVAVMYAGKIVEEAPVKDIFKEPLHPYTRGLLDSIPRLGQRKKRLASIAGSVPSAAALPAGCAFHPRCALKEDRCEKSLPDYRELRPGHWVACHVA